MQHCENFDKCEDEIVCLDLNKIFNEKGFIHSNESRKYMDNKFVKKIVLYSGTKENSIKIGKFFIARCENLIEVDTQNMSNVTFIDNHFLACCEKLTTLDTTGLRDVTNICNCFAYCCKSLQQFDTTWLSNVVYIGHSFLLFCTSLKEIDLRPMENLISFDSHFVSSCESLTSIDMRSLKKLEFSGNYLLYNTHADLVVKIDFLSGTLYDQIVNSGYKIALIV